MQKPSAPKGEKGKKRENAERKIGINETEKAEEKKTEPELLPHAVGEPSDERGLRRWADAV